MKNVWFTRYTMHLQHTGDPSRDWLLVVAVAWLDLLLNCQQDLSHEKFSEKENIFWVFLMRNAFDRYGWFSRRKKSFEYCFLETNILWLCTSFVFHKMKKTFGRFQVEPQQAYACKQILGVCHSPPWMEYQVISEKKSSKREKHYAMSSDKNGLKSLFMVYVSVSIVSKKEISLKTTWITG